VGVSRLLLNAWDWSTAEARGLCATEATASVLTFSTRRRYNVSSQLSTLSAREYMFYSYILDYVYCNTIVIRDM
jgi:hypothetical protein